MYPRAQDSVSTSTTFSPSAVSPLISRLIPMILKVINPVKRCFPELTIFPLFFYWLLPGKRAFRNSLAIAKPSLGTPKLLLALCQGSIIQAAKQNLHAFDKHTQWPGRMGAVASGCSCCW